MNMINLLIVSDIRFYREGLEENLERHGSIKVVGTTCDIEHTISEISSNAPDVVLIDMTLISSNEIVERLTSSCPGVKFIALAVTEDEDTILACAKAGVLGYVTREASIDQLINTVCGVVKGEIYCPRHIAASLFHKLKSISKASRESENTIEKQPSNQLKVSLTKREKQIAEFLLEGLSNKQIAQNLTIEVSTVKNHVHNILSKIGVHSRAQAVTILHRFVQIKSDIFS